MIAGRGHFFIFYHRKAKFAYFAASQKHFFRGGHAGPRPFLGCPRAGPVPIFRPFAFLSVCPSPVSYLLVQASAQSSIIPTSPDRAKSRPVRSPVPCAVQARMFPIEETQASVYAHLASNGPWKEWPYCKRRETKKIISFSEWWKPTHVFYWKDL